MHTWPKKSPAPWKKNKGKSLKHGAGEGAKGDQSEARGNQQETLVGVPNKEIPQNKKKKKKGLEAGEKENLHGQQGKTPVGKYWGGCRSALGGTTSGEGGRIKEPHVVPLNMTAVEKASAQKRKSGEGNKGLIRGRQIPLKSLVSREKLTPIGIRLFLKSACFSKKKKDSKPAGHGRPSCVYPVIGKGVGKKKKSLKKKGDSDVKGPRQKGARESCSRGRAHGRSGKGAAQMLEKNRTGVPPEKKNTDLVLKLVAPQEGTYYYKDHGNYLRA